VQSDVIQQKMTKILIHCIQNLSAFQISNNRSWKIRWIEQQIDRVSGQVPPNRW